MQAYLEIWWAILTTLIPNNAHFINFHQSTLHFAVAGNSDLIHIKNKT